VPHGGRAERFGRGKKKSQVILAQVEKGLSVPSALPQGIFDDLDSRVSNRHGSCRSCCPEEQPDSGEYQEESCCLDVTRRCLPGVHSGAAALRLRGGRNIECRDSAEW
jgi:hypothetical protein